MAAEQREIIGLAELLHTGVKFQLWSKEQRFWYLYKTRTDYLSYEFVEFRHGFSELMFYGRWTLTIPIIEVLQTFKVE
jgi:hypothetical protein